MDVRRWRKWWCAVGDGELTCTLYESLRLSEVTREASGTGSSSSTRLGRVTQHAHPPLVGGGGGGGQVSGSKGGGAEGASSTSKPEDWPCRVAQSTTFALATVSVREARQLSMPYVFEVISPQQTVTLQAQSQEEMAMWMQVIQNATASSLGCNVRTPGRSSTVSLAGTIWGRVRATAGNALCADCGASSPAWASINLGVVVCLTCAGVHRQMGVHISKVHARLSTASRPDALPFAHVRHPHTAPACTPWPR